MTYNEYFGFTVDPFSLEHDPRFLFISHVHEEAIAHIRYGVSQSRGFIMLTGEAGTGKTTTINHVVHNLISDMKAAFISATNADPLELLKLINQGFGLDVKSRMSHKDLMDGLNSFLLKCHNAHEKVLLVIDDAHMLNIECLEFIRLLSNLETDTNKLLQVALIGRPELRETVKRQSLRQLNQRIAVRYHLDRLGINDTGKYLNHRLHAAGSFGLSFPSNCIEQIYRFSGGVPGLINIAAASVLMRTFSKGELTIVPKTVKLALDEINDKRYKTDTASKWAPFLRPVLIILILTSVIAVAINIPAVRDEILDMLGFGIHPMVSN